MKHEIKNSSIHVGKTYKDSENEVEPCPNVGMSQSAADKRILFLRIKNMKYIYILFCISVTYSCGIGVQVYPNGKAGKDEVSWEYTNDSLNFRSSIYYGLDYMNMETKGLKKINLPRKYMRLLLENNPKILYSAHCHGVHHAYSFLMLVYDSPDSLTVFQKKIADTLSPEISHYALSKITLHNKQTLLCHCYSLQQSRTEVRHIFSCFTRWNNAQIINLILIENDHLTIFDQNTIEELFKTIK
jgi:hypothetical protein